MKISQGIFLSEILGNKFVSHKHNDIFAPRILRVNNTAR